MSVFKVGDCVVTNCGTGFVTEVCGPDADDVRIRHDGKSFSSFHCGGCDFCNGIVSIEDKHAAECKCKECRHA